MSRPIFKIIGGVIIASAVLFFITFLILKIALVFLVIKGFISLFGRNNKLHQGIGRRFPTALNDFNAPDFLHEFRNYGNANRNAKVVVIN